MEKSWNLTQITNPNISKQRRKRKTQQNYKKRLPNTRYKKTIVVDKQRLQTSATTKDDLQSLLGLNGIKDQNLRINSIINWTDKSRETIWKIQTDQVSITETKTNDVTNFNTPMYYDNNSVQHNNFFSFFQIVKMFSIFCWLRNFSNEYCFVCHVWR